jgi:hypothetical protein
MRSEPHRIVKLIAAWKFKFDLGTGVLPLVNFGLMSITAAPVVSAWTGVPTWITAAAIGVTGFVSIATLGYAMDRLGWFDAYVDEQNVRNKRLMQALEEKRPPT